MTELTETKANLTQSAHRAREAEKECMRLKGLIDKLQAQGRQVRLTSQVKTEAPATSPLSLLASPPLGTPQKRKRSESESATPKTEEVVAHPLVLALNAQSKHNAAVGVRSFSIHPAAERITEVDSAV